MASDGKNIDDIYERMREIACEEATRMLSADHWGTVKSVSEDGKTAEVLLDGGDATTPCATVVELSENDRALVNISPQGRKAIVKGNATDMSAGVESVEAVDARVDDLVNRYDEDLARFKGDLDALVETSKDAVQEAVDAAAARNQHFWDDDSGAHVTDTEREAYLAAKESGFQGATAQQQYPSLLMNALGILFKTCDHTDLSVTRGAVQFYDADDNVMASYSKSGVIIGDQASYHMAITESGLALYGEDGETVTAYLTGEQFHIGGYASSVETQYALGDSESAAPSGGWSSDSPSWEEGKFVWMRTLTLDLAGNVIATSDPVCIQGAKGADGQDGKPGANGASYYTYVRYSAYPNGSSMTASPTGSTKYIGVYTGTSASVPPYTAFTWSKYVGEDGKDGTNGTNGKDGSNGKDGADGKSVSISSTSVTYARSSSQSPAPTSGYGPSIPTLTSAYPYLWTKVVVNYTNGTSTWSTTSYSVSGGDGFLKNYIDISSNYGVQVYYSTPGYRSVMNGNGFNIVYVDSNGARTTRTKVDSDGMTIYNSGGTEIAKIYTYGSGTCISATTNGQLMAKGRYLSSDPECTAMAVVDPSGLDPIAELSVSGGSSSGYISVSLDRVNGSLSGSKCTINAGKTTATGDIVAHGEIACQRMNFNAKYSNNGVPSTVWPPGVICEDAEGRHTGLFGNSVASGGNIAAGIWAYNYNTSGTQVGSNSIQAVISKAGAATYSVTNAANFRSAIGAAASSDRRLKSEVEPLGGDAVAFVGALEPVAYTINGERQIGFIAQDVHEADPWGTRMAFETVEGVDGLDEWERMEDGSPTWKLDYIRIIPALTAALQDAAARVSELEARVASLESKLGS